MNAQIFDLNLFLYFVHNLTNKFEYNKLYIHRFTFDPTIPVKNEKMPRSVLLIF